MKGNALGMAIENAATSTTTGDDTYGALVKTTFKF
jgi:hypothetical protein